jgi:HTH-type transcriptional regulator/antitoxin HigA
MKYQSIMNKKPTKEKRIANDMIPGDIFHPGHFLAEEIEYRGIKQIELAKLLDISRSEMSLVINGKRNMTIQMAIKLEKALGIKAETWMNFQMGYEINLMRKRMADELKKIKIPAKKKTVIRTAITRA